MTARTLAVLALLGAAALGAPAPQEEGVDVVFVLDSSNSIAQSDPDGRGRDLLRAAADFLQGRAGDRVAVVQFAGWYETQEKKVVAFPLTPIPAPGKADEFRASFGAALAGVKVFGQASDVNVAFKEGLSRIAEGRGASKNPWWIVVVTDGDFDVLEPDKVRPEYKELAEKKFGGADVDTINQAAGEIFRTETRPNFVKASGSAVTMSGISLAKDPEGNKRIQDVVGDGARIGNLTATPLKDLLVPLIGTSPLLRPGRSGFYGYARGKTTVPVHVYEGATATRVLAYSFKDKDAKLKATWKGAGRAEVVGDGPYQVLHLRDVPAGDYAVEIEGGGPEVEAVAWAEFGHAASAKLLSKPTIAAGEKIAVEARVEVGGKPVAEPAFLADLSAQVQVKGPAGVGRLHDLRFEREGVAKFEMATEVPGEYELLVTFRGVPDGSFQPVTFAAGPVALKAQVLHSFLASFTSGKAPVWLGEPVTLQVRPTYPIGEEQRGLLKSVPVKRPDGTIERVEVAWTRTHWEGRLKTAASGVHELVPEENPAYLLRPVPQSSVEVKARAYTASFSKSEAFEREPVRILVRGEAGAPGGVRVRHDGKEETLPVRPDPATKGHVVDLPADASGSWEILVESGAGWEVKPGDAPRLAIKKRAFGVFAKAGEKLEPAREVVLDLKYREAARAGADLVLLFDVRKDEGAQVAATTESASGEGSLVFEQGGKSLAFPVAVAWEPGRLEFRLVVDAKGGAELPERAGTVRFKGTVAGLAFDHEVAVKVRYPDKAAKIFAKLLPWLVGGLVLLLLLAWWFSLARWGAHQLRYFKDNNLDTRHYLRDLHAGLMRRAATGTPELPLTLRFALSGLRFTARRVTAAPSKVTLTHQGRQVGGSTELKHGDELVVESERTLYRYIYFEREPSADEIQAALAGLIAGDEIFLEED